jgi:excinuclease ABC subunit B
LASIEELEAQMKAAAALLDFEEAARIRDIIRERSSAEERKK